MKNHCASTWPIFDSKLFRTHLRQTWSMCLEQTLYYCLKTIANLQWQPLLHLISLVRKGSCRWVKKNTINNFKAFFCSYQIPVQLCQTTETKAKLWQSQFHRHSKVKPFSASVGRIFSLNYNEATFTRAMQPWHFPGITWSRRMCECKCPNQSDWT